MVFLFTIAFIISLSGVASAYPVNGLVAQYMFAGDADDLVGSNDGVIHGATLTSDRFGNLDSAYSFDGINDYISMSRIIQDDFTISVWFNTTVSNPGADAWASRPLVYADKQSTYNDFGTGVVNNQFVFTAGNPDTSISSTSSVVSGNWVHAVVTRDKDTSEFQIYINGISEATGSNGNTASLSAQATMLIGGNTIDSRYFAGMIDDVLLYDRVLSATEIQELYNAPKPIPEPTTMLLLGAGLIGLAGTRRKMKKV